MRQEEIKKHFINKEMFINKISKFNPETYFIILLSFILLINIILIPVPRADNHLLSSDGGYYFSYMRSFIMDHDFDLQNDINIYNSRMHINNPANLKIEQAYNFSIGPALLWSPFFIIGHAVSLFLKTMGFAIATDGFSYVEESFVSIASIIYAMLGVFLIFKLLLLFFAQSKALIATIAVFLSSSSFYYTIFEPTMSHTLELFSVAFFIWTVVNINNGKNSKWVLTGFAAGIMVIVRWQNSIFLIILVYWAINYWIKEKNQVVPIIAKNIFFSLLGILPIVIIQMLFWESIFGSYLTIPQGKGFLHFTRPNFFEVLFSSRHGLFSWTPITFLGIAGLFVFKNRKLAIILFLIFVLDVYACSITEDWWAGSSYGQRRLIGLIPIFCIGFASLLNFITNIKYKNYFYVIVIFLIFWNFIFIIQYRLGFIPAGGYLTFNQMVVEKFTLPIKIIRKFIK